MIRRALVQAANPATRLRRISMLLVMTVLVVPVGCGPQHDSIPIIDGWIDDFEDGNLYSEIGFAWKAVSQGVGADAAILVQPGGILGSRYQLTVGGFRPTDASSDLVSGARLPMGQALDANRLEVTDVTAHEGLELRMRGTTGSYVIQLGTEAVTDFDYYNAYVEVTPDWALFRLPFEEFKQEGFGKARRWTGTDVTHVAFYATGPGTYTVALDDIRFY